MPPASRRSSHLPLAATLALALLAPGASAGASTGGAAYGQVSQTTAPAPETQTDPGGVAPSQPLPLPVPGTPVAPPQPGQVARLLPSGLAVPPAGAPAVIEQMIAAGNRIARTRYVWGGGHQRWEDRGYDCSGSVSYALYGAGLLAAPLVSGDLARWGDAGPGQWVTIYANAGHVYMIVAGLRFDTSGQRKAGSRWQSARRSVRGFKVRHPAGL